VVVPAGAQPSPSYEELAGLVAVLAVRVDALEAENAGLQGGERGAEAPPGDELGELFGPAVEGADRGEGRA